MNKNGKRIDYVIVIDSKVRKSYFIENFITSLEKQALELELHPDEAQKYIFITVHIPDHLVSEFADIYDIKLTGFGHGQGFAHTSSMNFFDFKQFKNDIDDREFIRQGGPTTKERILIAYEILKEAKFSNEENDYGIEKLIRLGIVKDAYPLHDGDLNLDETGDKLSSYPENDRQLLLKFWANFSIWYKEQPLNLIEKYFGTEVAFYFAWLGFYNRLLIPASVVGLLCSFISIVEFLVFLRQRAIDICESDILICPTCRSGKCVYLPLKGSCFYATVSIIFDNKETVFFAVFMSFWATVFRNLWKRAENTLKIQWNVDFEETDTKLRVEYKEKSKYITWSPLHHKPQPYTPFINQAFAIFLSYSLCLLMIGIVILFMCSLIVYRVLITDIMQKTFSAEIQSHVAFILQLTSACIQVFFIKLFSHFYGPVSEWLTDIENPRTETEYDNSVIGKRYILAFANNYGAMFYIAFIMDRFYSPDDPPNIFEADRCEAIGCLMPLCVQLCFILLFKSMLGNIITLMGPKLTKPLNKKINDKRPQWEKEFYLKPVNRYFVSVEFMEMIIQYGFVTFFVAAFPLAPLCALINNCLELRLDAYKLVTRYRRPVPKQNSGIEIWNGIVGLITHISVATNAFVLAFTSDIVARIMYRRRHSSFVGYIKSSLSLYDMKDYNYYKEQEIIVNASNSTLCYYKALRYPPDHPKKYELTDWYWYDRGVRLLCVIIFEHVIMITNGILAYFIPDVPQHVREMLHYERTKKLELKLKVKTTGILRRRFTKIHSNLIINKGKEKHTRIA